MGLLDAPAVQPIDVFSPAKNARALRAFRSALGDRHNNPCNIYCMGDSTVEGSGTGSTIASLDYGWPSRLADLLRKRYPTVGETTPQGRNFVPINNFGTIPTGWTKGGTWTTDVSLGPNSGAARTNASDTAHTLSYTIPIGCTAFDIVVFKGAGGFTATLDGSALFAGATKATFGEAPSGGKDGALYRVTVADPTITHALVITSGANGGNTCVVDGIALYYGNEAKGLRVWNAGHHGSDLRQWVITGSVSTWGKAGGIATPQGANCFSSFGSHLIIVDTQINDWGGSGPVTKATYKTRLQELITLARAQFTSATQPLSFLLLGLYDHTTAGTLNSQGATVADLIAGQREVAAADADVTHLDISKRMPNIGSQAGTDLGLYADTVHANAKGYSWIADEIADFLSNA